MIEEETTAYNEASLLSPRKLELIKKFRLIDDTFFAVCLDNDNVLAELILRTLLEKDDLQVLEAKTQYSIKGLGGHSAILDALAIDALGQLYNIEVQRSDKGAVPQRARYYGGLIDTNFFPKGEKYKNLPETYVIFITEDDVLGDDLPIYHIERIITETGKPFNDGLHIVYVNAQHTDDTRRGKLMHDFLCANPHEMYYTEFSDKAAYYKENKKGVNHMCQLLEDAIKEEREEAYEKGIEKGIEKGRAEERAKIEQERAEERAKAEATRKAERNAMRMIKKGLSVEEIAEFTELPLENVRELAEILAG